MRLILFVEGRTEKSALPAFLKQWLDTRAPERTSIRVVQFTGWASFYKEIAIKAHLHLGRQGPPTIGLGLMDLYGPDFYPDSTSSEERYEWAKSHMEALVDHPRFRQHFATHESEAWLLSDPALLPPQIRSSLPGKCQTPEAVDFDEPPSQLLNRLYKQQLRRRYRKTIDGSNLFQKLNPERVAEKCPNFKRMLDEVLSLIVSSATA